jgi:PTS system beta-glucosides-specific IIC component
VSALGQTGAAFGMALRMKNKETRSMTTSTVISGIFGITEPIIYGITLPRKKPFIIGCIGGAVGGAVSGIIGGAGYTMGAFGVLSLPSAISPTGIGHGFFGALAGMAVSFAVASILCVLTYRDDTQA